MNLNVSQLTNQSTRTNECAFPSFSKIFMEKPAWILILLFIVYFYRPILFGDVFYYRDLHSHFVPKKVLVAEAISRFELPVWDPYLQGGKPLLGNPNNMVLYPTNLLYVSLSPGTALTIEIILHLLLGALGMYAFCRILNFAQASSFIAAAIYGFSGYALSNINLLNWLIASAHIPLLFSFWHKYLTQSKARKYLVLALAASSLQILAGAPELSLITFTTLLAWTIVYPYRVSIGRKLANWVGVVFFTFCICAIQILPAIEISSASIRSVGFGFDSSTTWSLHPYHMLEFVFPGLLGQFDSTQASAYWGEKLTGGGLPFFLSMYFGLTSLVLALAGAFSKQENATFPRQVRIVLFCTSLVFLVLATGRFLPGIKSVYDYFSLRVPFRFPVKFFSGAVFPLSLLTAFGSQILFASNKNASNKTKLVFWLINAFLLSLAISFSVSNDFASGMIDLLFGQSLTPQIMRALIFALLHCLTVWTLVCLLFQTRLTSSHRLVAGLILLDLAIAGVPLKILGQGNLYEMKPPLAHIVRSQLQDGNLFRIDAPDPVVKKPERDLFTAVQQHHGMLSGYLASNHEIPVIFHDDLDASSLIELNFMRLVMGSLPWPRKLPVLSAANVSLILTPEQLSVEGLRAINRFDTTPPLYLYANEGAVGSIAFVPQSVVAKSPPDTLRIMTQKNYDAKKVVILRRQEAPMANGCAAHEVLQKKQGMRSLEYEVVNDCDGYYVFSQPYYPGWQLYVDGQKTKLWQANSIFSAAFVPKGTHDIYLTYLPKSVIWGTALSVLSILLLAAALLTSGKSRISR